MKLVQISSVFFALCLVALTGCKDDPVYWDPDADNGGGGGGETDTDGGGGTTDTGGGGETDTGGGGETDTDTGGGETDTDTGGGETDTDTGGETDTEDGGETDTDTGGDTDTEDGGDCPDEDGDGVCDDDDRCPGFDDALCTAACSGSEGLIEVFGNGELFGCTGQVIWNERASLCGPGYRVAPAEAWVNLRGSDVPTHHYWTDDHLVWDANHGYDDDQCAAGYYGMRPFVDNCTAGPMRVCAPDAPGSDDVADPLGNTCTWVNCGWLDHNQNDYFGGCSSGGGPGNYAGTLCLWLDDVRMDSVRPDGAERTDEMSSAMRGNAYQVGSEGRILTGFQQLIQVNVPTQFWAYIWKGTGQGDEYECWDGLLNQHISWEPLVAKNLGEIAAGTHNLGLLNLHIDLPPGTYVSMALAWYGGEAVNQWFAPENYDFTFGRLLPTYVATNNYQLVESWNRGNYVPNDNDFCQDENYQQDIFSTERPVSAGD